MKKIFHAYPEVIIVTLAVVFLAVLAVCYTWAINVIYGEVHQALTSSLPQSSDAFDLAGAAKLDLRGLMGASSTPSASVVPSAPPPPAVSTTTPSARTISPSRGSSSSSAPRG